jgi:hypothetical protein
MLGFGVGAAIAGFIPNSITSLTCAQSSTDTFIDRLTNYQCNLQTLVLLSMVIILGLTGGFMQWLVLRRRIPGTGWWVPASTLNFPAAPAVANGVLIMGGGLPSAAPILLGILVAILSGILPWLVLRRRLARSGWWIPAHRQLVRLRNDDDGKVWEGFTAASREISDDEEVIVGRVSDGDLSVAVSRPTVT